MKKLLFLLILVSQLGMAQELDSLYSDSAEVVSDHLFGVYLIGGLAVSPNPTESGLGWVKTVGVGFRYDKLEAGITVSAFDTHYERRLVFPNAFQLRYGYGGGYLSYHLKETRYVGFSPYGAFQLGDVIWERSDTGESFLREKFSLFQVGVKVDFPVLQDIRYATYLRPELVLGYQRMSEINLSGVSGDDFSGFFIGFNVKLGYFNQ